MTSINKIVLEELRKSPFLEEGLADGTINISAVARQLQPVIANTLHKPVSPGSVIMAIKRNQSKLQSGTVSEILAQTFSADFSIKSRLSLFVLQIEPQLYSVQQNFLAHIAQNASAFFTTCHATAEATWIMNQQYESVFRTFARDLHIIGAQQNISAITVGFLDDTTDTAVVYYRFFKTLAWANIPVVEVLSAGSELTLFFDDSVVDKAFSLLKGLQNNRS